MGRSKGGMFRHTRAETLSATLIKALIERNPGVEAADVADVIWGCVQQTCEQGMNIGRNAGLLAGLPSSVPGQTVNRLCGSSMQAIHNAAASIGSGDDGIYVCGGVEHMGHVPMDYNVDIAPAMSKVTAQSAATMGLTAELLGRQAKVSREKQDAFALASHQRAKAAFDSGAFDDEIVAAPGVDDRGFARQCRQDEVVRSDTSLEALAALRPAFDPRGGTVTAGNSSALSDGAAATLVMSADRAETLGLTPLASIRATYVAGCSPSIMGHGPVPASKSALQSAGVTLDDIEFIELNEAFAAQSIAVLQELGLDDRRDMVNVRGGAIALGHPLGASGARITGALARIMSDNDARLGLATMCIGMGQGIATVLERPTSN